MPLNTNNIKKDEWCHWATVYKESGSIKDVVLAKNKKMAEKLLIHNYSDSLKNMLDVKKVSITVHND